jgi:hypothetical protein
VVQEVLCLPQVLAEVAYWQGALVTPVNQPQQIQGLVVEGQALLHHLYQHPVVLADQVLLS